MTRPQRRAVTLAGLALDLLAFLALSGGVIAGAIPARDMTAPAVLLAVSITAGTFYLYRSRAVSAPVSVVLAVIGFIVSAHVRVKAVLLGLPLNVSLLGLIWAVLILALVALVLGLIHAIMQDRPPRESRPVHVITSLR